VLDQTLRQLEPVWHAALKENRAILPDRPAALARLLAQLDDEQLLALPRQEAVHRAILLRGSVSAEARRDALAALAQSRGVDPLQELMHALEQADRAGAEPALAQLGALLAGEYDATALQTLRERLTTLARRGQTGMARRTAMAALIVADGSVDATWRIAQRGDRGREAFAHAAEMVADPALRDAMLPRLIDMMSDTAAQPSVRRAAVESMAHFAHRAGEAATALTTLLADPQYREIAVATMLHLPAERWPASQQARTAEALVALLSVASLDKRTTEAGERMTTLARTLSDALPPDQAASLRHALDDLHVTTILVRPIRDSLLFDRRDIYVPRGRPVQIIFENTDSMPHNFVVTAQGSMAQVGLAAERMAMDADAADRHYVPEIPQVLHATRLLMPGQTDRLLFFAPEEAGTWPYVCTYPGHWSIMNGKMHVVDEVDATLVQHEPAEVQLPTGHAHDLPPREFVRNWSVADLTPELRRVAQGRSFERGKEVFRLASCNKCHQMQGQGATIGPDLTDAHERFSLEELLQQVIDPSSVINPDYHAWTIETVDFETFHGLIVQEDERNVHMAWNMLDPTDILIIPKEDIVSRQQAELSMMPNGLLITFNKEEILDLMAYLQAGGEESHAIYGEQENR